MLRIVLCVLSAAAGPEAFGSQDGWVAKMFAFCESRKDRAQPEIDAINLSKLLSAQFGGARRTRY